MSRVTSQDEVNNMAKPILNEIEKRFNQKDR